MEILSRTALNKLKLIRLSCLVAVLAGCYAGQAFAVGCYPVNIGGIQQGAYTGTIIINETLAPKGNVQGTTITHNAAGSELGWGGTRSGTVTVVGGVNNEYLVTCDCSSTGVTTSSGKPGMNEVFFKVAVNGVTTGGGSPDSWVFQPIAGVDGISIATQVYLAGSLGRYIATPFDSISSGKAAVIGCNAKNFATGLQGKIALLFSKPVIGRVTFSIPDLLTVYAGTTVEDARGATEPLIKIGIGQATITVPQECTINSGTVVELDLGKFASSDFANKKGQEIGQRTFSKDIAVKCTSVVDGVNVTAKLTATPDPNGGEGLVKTSNDDISLKFLNSSGDQVKPGEVFPVQYTPSMDETLDGGLFQVGAVAVSSTGNAPEEGVFSGTAQLSVVLE